MAEIINRDTEGMCAFAESLQEYVERTEELCEELISEFKRVADDEAFSDSNALEALGRLTEWIKAILDKMPDADGLAEKLIESANALIRAQDIIKQI